MRKKSRILIACEESQQVTKAFRKLGYQAYSCDIEPCSGGHPEWHIQEDVLKILKEKWDLMIAHPPCTYLSKAGALYWKDRKDEQNKALRFVKKLMKAPIPRIVIENPIGKIGTAIRKADQIINPYEFGDPWIKHTCLWLKNLPLLTPTKIVEPVGHWIKGSSNKIPGRRFYGTPGGANWHDKKKRSKTFSGIAKAMAKQWSQLPNLKYIT